MSRTARYTAMGLATVGLVGGSLLAPTTVFADPRGDSGKEVSGSQCLRSDHNRDSSDRNRDSSDRDRDSRECTSKTTLDVFRYRSHDERSRDRSHSQRVKLVADVDFFKKGDDRGNRDDRGRNDDRNGGRSGRHDDLGEVSFQYKDRHDWRTFATKDVDDDGVAKITVRIELRRHDEVTLRAKYSGVEDKIKGSTSDEVEIH